MIPTPRAILLMLAAAPCALLVALLAPAVWWSVPAIVAVIIGAIAFDAVMTPSPKAVEVALTMPRAAGVGDAFTATATMTAASRGANWLAALRSPELAVQLDEKLSESGRGDAVLVVAGDTAVAEMPLAASARGKASVGPAWVRWTGRLGLAQRQSRVKIAPEIAISPSIKAVEQHGVPLFQRDAQIGQRLNARIGEGSEFESLVRFMPGLDRRAIDWKQSARHFDLLAKQYETERDNRLVLAIDSGRLMNDPVVARDGTVRTRLDWAVAAALTLGYVGLKLEDRVSMTSFAARPGGFSREFMRASDFAALRRFSADVPYSFEETNFTWALAEVQARLKRRALVVVFTEFADAASAEIMLRAASRLIARHLVMFVVLADGELDHAAHRVPVTAEDVAAATLAADLLRDRRIVLTRLRRMGAIVMEAPAEGLATGVLEQFIRIKRRGML